MWICIYAESGYRVEKRMTEEMDNEVDDEGKSIVYPNVEAYVADRCLGRYRLLSSSGQVVGGSPLFKRILEWIAGEPPGLMQSAIEPLGIGAYIKEYRSDRIIVLATEGFALYSNSEYWVSSYSAVIGINRKDYLIELQLENGSVLALGVIDSLEKELMTLCLHKLEDVNDPAKELAWQCIAEGLSERIPLYDQKPSCVFGVVNNGSFGWVGGLLSGAFGGAPSEYLAITQDFLVFSRAGSYFAIPLDMVRRVEVAHEGFMARRSSTRLKIRDANQREFVAQLAGAVGLEEVRSKIGRPEKTFKAEYISVVLDMAAVQAQGGDDIDIAYQMYIEQNEQVEVLNINHKQRPFKWVSWFCICGMASHPRFYEQTLTRHNWVDTDTTEQIDKDLSRASYTPSTNEAGLRRALLGFALENNSEYLQTHSLIGEVLYRTLGEHGTFLGLHHIFKRIMPGYTGPNIYGLQRDVHVLLVFIKERFLGLYENLTGKSIELEILVTPWLVGLFTTVFGRSYIERVFDHIGCYGAVFVFRLSLGLLERMYRKLSWSDKNSSMLKAAKDYLFKGGSVPSIDEKEFSILLETAVNTKFITPERVSHERNKYEISHRQQCTST
ncbi:hypothetical protein NEHOM01_0048 [Nematocida homosporus]|uniref:uncharacterized protein n=1 Tax=Nematocida homosporus TaxID=1912981 RepID=UPI00221EAE0E|nr:uncharacterized protein NEHOM01_0048 [Nematocida homosporus]KAI5184303.1 hypothetical protein NEHOM01_0048 [Nematocida homosporus]